ncbi:hypothetical protein [Streptomyces sp. TRM49041]|uniref:hypothetical protein n=1 Tax=Streptomyces sp. TRM49041 TaxID=2603216 RepID=UPI0011EBAA1A|nr:hypothetical protein [Streptomyces sp. TRM49041]
MRGTSFHSAGTTTAFADAWQESWWDPEKGLRIKTTGGDVPGEMYCKDGTSYISAQLFAATLKERGQHITVPDRLSDVFVTTESGHGCDAYFKIPDGGELQPAKDESVNGTPAQALTVSSGANSGTYLIDAADTTRPLRLDSVHDGRTSTVTYDSFGEKFTISVPSGDKVMTLPDFRKQVTGS